MPDIQEQYTEFTKRGQEAAQQVVDQFFDFGATVIDAQRNLVKQFISTSASVAQNVSKNLTERTSE
jgi:hypothetical protein